MFALAVLISGRGSNLTAIQENIEKGLLNAQIKLVISSRPDAKGLEFAKAHHLPAFISKSEEEIINKLKEVNPNLICLAGYMKILSPKFVNTFKGKIINIHPALLPKFPGLDVQKRAIEAGEKESGCTVHYVDEGMDTGAIIAQRKVPILLSDTADTLSERILKEEHVLYTEVIGNFVSGKLG
jgi:phosphoribosylglycinamide formyltransferase-1